MTFLLRCHEHPALAPLVLRTHTAWHAPSGARPCAGLWCNRRWPVATASRTEDLVDEMLAEVAEERGALPLLAFAASRLWEKRDRQTRAR